MDNYFWWGKPPIYPAPLPACPWHCVGACGKAVQFHYACSSYYNNRNSLEVGCCVRWHTVLCFCYVSGTNMLAMLNYYTRIYDQQYFQDFSFNIPVSDCERAVPSALHHPGQWHLRRQANPQPSSTWNRHTSAFLQSPRRNPHYYLIGWLYLTMFVLLRLTFQPQ